MKLLIITQKVDENDQLLGFFTEWLVRFAKRFEKITIVCLEKGKFSLPKNVRVISLGKDRKAGKLKQLFNFYFLLFALRKEYNAVFAHMNPIWVVLGGLFWRLMRKKIFFWYTSGGVTAKLKLAEKFADTIFTASKESFRLPSKKVVVTGHGIDTELFQPQEYNRESHSDKLKILSVGRIAPVKNYEVLVNASKILADNGVLFSVTIIGESVLKRDKDYESKIKNQLKELDLSGYFNFVGKVSQKNLPAYYQFHDLFVHLSKTGSVDKVLLEAMASGVAVLSSNESSRSFLPSELIFKEDDSSELAYKIKKARSNHNTYHLREYVVANHNLDNLIEKISTFVKK